ncbi:MAG: hypothetical protein SW127_21760 [Actinomycetota bacterium]|nr:hypothetical protein [Actinomycetota bacterium]
MTSKEQARHKHVTLAMCIAAVLVLVAACSSGDTTVDPSGTSASTAATDQRLLQSSDLPDGYDIYPGDSSQELSDTQMQMVNSREYDPAECKDRYRQQADATAASQRVGIYAEKRAPSAPSFGDFIIRGGQSLTDVEELFSRCGDHTATVPGEGRITMVSETVEPPTDFPASATFAVNSTVETVPTDPEQVATKQQSLIGYAELPGSDSVVQFYSEVYGYGIAIDGEQFWNLFGEAYLWAAVQD